MEIKFSKMPELTTMISGGIVKNPTVFLLGMERSGTSVTAAVLDAIGVHMDGSNDGHFERNVFKTGTDNEMYIEIDKLGHKYDCWGCQVNINLEQVVNLMSMARNPYLISVFRDPVAITERVISIKNNHITDEVQLSIDLINEIWNITKILDFPKMFISAERMRHTPERYIKSFCHIFRIRLTKKLKTKALNRIGKSGYLLQ